MRTNKTRSVHAKLKHAKHTQQTTKNRIRVISHAPAIPECDILKFMVYKIKETKLTVKYLRLC